jgi:hypothetical protein
MRKKMFVMLIIVAIGIVVSSCASSIDVSNCLPDKVYGFWNGIWHGMIAPFVWIGNLFGNDNAIYAINNNGNWYDFGFLLGLGGGGGGASSATRRRR